MPAGVQSSTRRRRPGPAAPGPSQEPEEETPPGRHAADAEEALWTALRAAPEEGATVPDLMAATRMSRPWVYLRLRELTEIGRVVQAARGRWRAA